jgi:glutathionylspermidine synthase
MRTVLIGSDFMYDKNGDLKPIEINTSTGWSMTKVESDDEIYDFTTLSQFIQENEFTKVTYIYNSANKAITNRLEELMESINVEFLLVRVNSQSITIPNIEDSDEHLIIRQAYDTTALVDDMYCRNKVNFLNLIKNEEYGFQFAYMNEEGQLVSNITSISDNGNQPNSF